MPVRKPVKTILLCLSAVLFAALLLPGCGADRLPDPADIAAALSIPEDVPNRDELPLSDEQIRREQASGAVMARLTEAFRRAAGLGDGDRPWLQPEEYPPAYGGFYINADGDPVLLITEGFEGELDTFREIAGDPGLLWRAVPHSYTELLTLLQTILPYMGKPALGFDLREAGVDDRGNCLRVSLASADEASVAAFRETVTDSDAVVIGQRIG